MGQSLAAVALVAATVGALPAVVQAGPAVVSFAATDHDAGPGPRSVALGDVNGDTFVDVAVANFAGRSTSVLLGDGTGGFGASDEFATGAGPHSVALGDVNEDTFPDLATANFDAGTVSVLLGDGTGGFGAKTDLVMGGAPIGVAVVDLNDDAHLDLAVANWFSQTVSVLLGDGAGHFAAPSSYPVDGTAHSVAVGDVNGDTAPDLAVANGGSASVSVLLGDGAGGFEERTDYATGGEPRSVAVVDLNGDTLLDLATADSSSATVSVLLGDGLGDFGARTVFATGEGPFSIAAGDLNGDHLVDLATANSASASVSVLLGDGTGGFETGGEFATGDGPEAVAIGDLNGDLRLDMGAGNRSSNSVSVLLNTTGDPVTLPGPPTIGTATAGNVQATVSWIPPASNGGARITGYVVTPYIGAVAQTQIPVGVTPTTQTITGLSNGTTYTFTVAATNSEGTGSESDASNAVTPAPTVPGAPRILSNATAGHESATVSWTAPASDGGATVTGYVVTPYISYFPLSPVTFGSTVTTQTITGLTNGTKYRFRVRAVNTIGTGPYSRASNPVTPTALPGPPTIGSATPGNGQATVSWTAPTSQGATPITGYVVTPYISYFPLSSVVFSSTATTQIVTGLTNGTTYRFRVQAINDSGTGPYSRATNPVTPAA